MWISPLLFAAMRMGGFARLRSASTESYESGDDAQQRRDQVELALTSIVSAAALSPSAAARFVAAADRLLVRSGARRMTPLRAQALLEPEDSSSSDFVESPEEESLPEVSDSDGGNTSSGADDRRGAGEASPSLTVTSVGIKLNLQAHSAQREAAQSHTKHKPEKNQHCWHPDAAAPAQARSRADKQPKGQAIKQHGQWIYWQKVVQLLAVRCGSHTKHKPEKNQHCWHPDAAPPAQARSRADKQPKAVAESVVAARDGGDAAAMPKDRRDPTDAGEEAGELGPAASTPVVSSSPDAGSSYSCPVSHSSRRQIYSGPLSKGADKHRRLATKLALAAIRSFLDQHFLSSHPRAIQFGLDRDGCLKFSQTASALLPLHARGDDEDVANPTVLVSLDAKNAFNSLDRQALFDAIEGRASRDYFDGSITEGASLPSCEHLRLFASYLSSYYGDSADLRLFHKSQSASVQCTSGVCQGDVPSSVFFCHSIHPLLLHIAELFPSVRVLAYADNVVLVGPLEDAVAATSAMKKYMLADLKLEIQPRESKVYIPSWHQHPDLSQLKKSLKRRLKTQLLHFEVVTGGITLGGLPIGTDGFHASQLRAKVSTLNEELSKLGLVQHGFMFKTLVRASHLQKLRFFLQGSSPFLPRVQSQIRRFDLSVHLGLEKYHRWPSSQYLAAHPDLLEFARFKRELPHSRGGDEFTPSEGLHPAVYYTAIARFLAWYSDQPMSRTLPSPHSLDVHYSVPRSILWRPSSLRRTTSFIMLERSSTVV
ncbi:hypothetical protein GUITHDRAFT_112513 [Guillardia theta CCMP2712]|uniref:Reverse transcriptase domain-containing protein n=1 Tax=Guillardia theta (strain CCMP2712) TaxID=905079 RepID=L1J0C4_GUITC|nr:hypothetical protein GUITHDRAFT_112513 [Guillardia theta CCMP2712]EKX41540.1 hypothetical protein GUITHDRAFT_112513 [Guillardia theta CCMP2712]|eukprot:XP_005828520.1 hypothetical protein GUITHDRAFT_112513 [Guillardia theta CCMP2712]